MFRFSSKQIGIAQHISKQIMRTEIADVVVQRHQVTYHEGYGLHQRPLVLLAEHQFAI